MDEAALDCVVVLCTVPNADVGDALARGLVEARLAACVNRIGPIHSTYRWKGAVHAEAEHQLLIKTTPEALSGVRDFLAASHPLRGARADRARRSDPQPALRPVAPRPNRLSLRARARTTYPFRRRGIPSSTARSPRNTPSIPRHPVVTGGAPRRRSDPVVHTRALSDRARRRSCASRRSSSGRRPQQTSLGSSASRASGCRRRRRACRPSRR
jgi:periplasmic divalent cation tolerance protein